MAAVSGESDLKSAISDANFKLLTGNVKASKADPDDKFYLKQAEHMIRGGNNSTALHFVNTALRFNPNNRVRNPSELSTINFINVLLGCNCVAFQVPPVKVGLEFGVGNG